MVALVAVGLVVLLAVVVGAVVLLGGDDDDTASTTTTTSSSTTRSTETTAPTVSSSSTPTSSSTSIPPDRTTASTPLTTPGSTGALPEGFPEPPGATPSLTGGIDVTGTADEVAAFYQENLPAAGYEVGSEYDVGVGRSYSVTGQGVDGQLLLVDLGTGTVSVIWTDT